MTLWLAGYPKTPDFDVQFWVNRIASSVCFECPLLLHKRRFASE